MFIIYLVHGSHYENARRREHTPQGRGSQHPIPGVLHQGGGYHVAFHAVGVGFTRRIFTPSTQSRDLWAHMHIIYYIVFKTPVVQLAVFTKEPHYECTLLQ